MILPFDTLRTGKLPLPAGGESAIPLAPGGHWFGHGFSHDQPFPLESGRLARALPWNPPLRAGIHRDPNITG